MIPLLDPGKTMARLKMGFGGMGPFYRSIPKQPARRFVDPFDAQSKSARQVPGNVFTGKTFSQRKK